MQCLVCLLGNVSIHVSTCRPVSESVRELKVDHTECDTFTFSHLADAFIQSDLQLGNT